MLARLKHMLIKEFIQMLRDPRMRAVILLVPIIQLVIFGYAVNTDVKQVPIAIYDLDQSPRSRELVSRFQGSDAFYIVEYLKVESAMDEGFNRGHFKAVLSIPYGFSKELTQHRPSAVQFILDGSDSNTASIALGYANRIAMAHNRDLLAERQNQSGQSLNIDAIQFSTRHFFNENLTSRFFFLPGVIAQLVMIISIILSSMSIVREREMGTMEQIMATPIGRSEFILGKTLPFAAVGFLNVALVTLVARLWFQVPFTGSFLLLFFSTGLFLLSTLGIGLFISTVSRTQQQAMLSSVFFAMPAILLSGFIYPIANMPQSVQWLTFFNPLRYFLVIIRGIFLKNTGIEILWPQLLALAILGSVSLSLAAMRFRKTVL